MSRETKAIIDQSPKLDKDTLVVFALDVDETAKRTLIYVDGDEDNINIPKYCLSPRLLDFIREEKEKAQKAGAGCSFLMNTHRCIDTELLNVNRDYRAHFKDLEIAKRLILERENPYTLNFDNFNPEYCFTYKVVENLIKETGLEFLGVSTPDDLTHGRKFGDGFRLTKREFQKIAQNPQYDRQDKHGLSPFSETRELENIPHEPLYDNSSKNQQIIQFAWELSQKNPNKRIVLKIIDDSEKILENAKRLGRDLPDNVTIELYHHIALDQTEITSIAKIQGEKQSDSFNKRFGPIFFQFNNKTKIYREQIESLLNLSRELQKEYLSEKAPPNPLTSDKFLEHWLDLESRKKIEFDNTKKLMDEAKQLLDDPLIKVRDRHNKPLLQFNEWIAGHMKSDLFKRTICPERHPERKKVHDTISEFLKAKTVLYFKPQSTKEDSKATDLSDVDYIKQWLEFREKHWNETKNIISQANLALISIKEAMTIANQENDEQYLKELKKLRVEVLDQINTIVKEEEIFNVLYTSIKPHVDNIKKNTKSILKEINDVLVTKGIVDGQNCSTELHLLKKKVENIDPDYQTYMKAEKLQKMVKDAVDEYIGGLKNHKSSLEFAFFHRRNGTIAKQFMSDIDRLMLSEKNKLEKRENIKDLPEQLLANIMAHIERGPGRKLTHSFKTILERRLELLTTDPEINRIFFAGLLKA